MYLSNIQGKCSSASYVFFEGSGGVYTPATFIKKAQRRVQKQKRGTGGGGGGGGSEFRKQKRNEKKTVEGLLLTKLLKIYYP